METLETTEGTVGKNIESGKTTEGTEGEAVETEETYVGAQETINVGTPEIAKGRLLGFSESFYHLIVSKYSTSIYWQVGVINSTKQLLDSDVETTLKILARKQEILQMRILPVNPDETNPVDFQFQLMDDPEKIDFESVSLRHKDDWPKHIHHDHDTHKIDPANGPLWRCILGHVLADGSSDSALHEYVIFLKLHHGIADGKSGSDFLYRQFLPVLSAVSNGVDPETNFPYVPLTKSVENLFLTPQKLKNPVPWYIKLALGVLRWKNRLFPPAEKPANRFKDDVMPTDGESNCVPKVFDVEITDAVIKAAKKHAVTVHCVLLVAGAIALSRTADAAGVKMPGTFQQLWPVDLRKFLDYKTPQPLGVILASGISNVKGITDCSVEKFWSLCQNLYPSVRQGARREKCTAFLGLNKYFLDEQQKSDVGTLMNELSMNAYMGLSNVGNVSAGSAPDMTEGPVKLRMTEQFFSISGAEGSTLIPIFQPVLTFEGRFMWNVIHDPRTTSRKYVDTYYENLEDVMKTFCTE